MLPSNASDWEKLGPTPEKRRSRGGLVVTLVLVVVLIAIIAFAVARLSGTSLGRPGAAAAPTRASVATQSAAATPNAATASAPADAGAPADAATAQTIQQVIQQVDQAQIQAILTNDPNVMAATATPEFYQEQVVNNQDLVGSGVTDIKLLNMEWGPITINGNTATATVWETWSTTFNDGTTEQARDRNVYTLVLDNGTWKVKADDHPDQPPPGATPGTGGPAPGP